MARSRAFHNTIRLLVIELHGKSQNNKRCFNLGRINYDNIRINYVNLACFNKKSTLYRARAARMDLASNNKACLCYS